MQPVDSSPRGASLWASARFRLALLLAGLLLALAALLSVRVGLFDLGGGPAPARGAAFAAGCPGRDAPEVARASASGVATLRSSLARTAPSRFARVYEAGTVETTNLWSDEQPRPAPGAQGGSAPAGYETRWWVLDRDGNEDDVVADALEFATARQAQAALAAGASAHCRRDGVAQTAQSPSGARLLNWLNPDSAREWDVLFARGRRVYRLAYVPPSYPPVRGKRKQVLASQRDASTAAAFACALDGAACSFAAHSTNLAALAAGAAVSRTSGSDVARQLRAYARAVNMRAYDVPAMKPLTHERASADRSDWQAFVSCTGELGSAPRAQVQSPLFSSRTRRQYSVATSDVSLLASEALADRYVRGLASARARACIRRIYEHRALGHAAGRSRLHVTQVTIAPLPTPTPASWRGARAYLATAMRGTISAEYERPGGRRYRIPIYVDDVAFAYGRAVVALASESTPRPFSQTSEQYVIAKLVGRAQVGEG